MVTRKDMIKTKNELKGKSSSFLVRFFYEAGCLKLVKRTGWWIVGVKDPESVADHVSRTGLIAYILAYLEGANPERAASICLIHDLHEVRTNDAHKIAAKYLDMNSAEKKAFADQMKLLPKELQDTFTSYLSELNNRSSPEGIVAKDADYLECAFQAKEYLERGYLGTQDWLDNIEPRLKTKSAKKLFKELCQQSSTEWFIGLKKLEKVN